MKLKYKNTNYYLKIKENDNKLSFENENGTWEIFKNDDNNYYGYVNGRRFPIVKSEDKKHIYVYALGEYYIFEKIEDINYDILDNKVDENIEEIYAPTPGTIIKILVENGQIVKSGEAVLTLESMKMENTIYASIDGKVTEINITEKEKVNTDKLLILIKKE